MTPELEHRAELYNRAIRFLIADHMRGCRGMRAFDCELCRIGRELMR